MLCARNHCSAVLRSHRPLEIAARACRGATWRPKSPLEHAFSCSATLAKPPQRYRSEPGLEQTSLDSTTLSRFLRNPFRNPFRNRSASNSALLRAMTFANAPSSASKQLSPRNRSSRRLDNTFVFRAESFSESPFFEPYIAWSCALCDLAGKRHMRI